MDIVEIGNCEDRVSLKEIHPMCLSQGYTGNRICATERFKYLLKIVPLVAHCVQCDANKANKRVKSNSIIVTI